jgi:hypothetical protein
MANQYWFRPKSYGYGATPSTWEGWAATAVHVAVVLVCVFLMVWYQENYSLIAASLTVMFLSTVWLVWLCRRKTEGEWRWRWGKK